MQLKKQIYRKMYLLIIVASALITLLLAAGFYQFFDKQMQDDVRVRTMFFEKSLNYSADNLDYISSLKLSENEARLSIINADGTVGYDSYEDNTALENHLDRPEVAKAFESGYGESKRFSDTLGEETFYCAVALNDGTVLRLAQTTSSIYSLFLKILPLVLLTLAAVALLAYVAAMQVTQRIVEPINKLDLEQNEDEIKTYDELIPFVRTILAQKQEIKSQLSIVESHATTITAITQSMGEGLLLLDAGGRIISVNRSALSAFSQHGDFVDRHILEFTRDPDILSEINAVIAGETQHNRKVITLGSGSLTRQYEMLTSPVHSPDRLIGVVVLLLDITDRILAEQQRREFSANVSHELKTPLTTISGYAEMISTGMVHQPDIPVFSGKIRDEASRLLNLIEDIIRLSELDEAKGKQGFEPFNLTSMAQNVTESLKPEADKRSIVMTVTGDELEVVGNPRMLDELLYNLIDNAIKYNRPCGAVDVDITRTNDMAHISVHDSGIGIAPADRERVFERFYRVDRSRSKKTGGTGLGLAIVKHIAGYHDGTVALHSQENVGTTIEVSIPLRQE